MKIIEDNKNCTGCLACLNCCSSNAIRLEYSIDGFFYPIVDENLCCKCGKCINTCLVNKKETEVIPKLVVDTYTKDIIYREYGSSGGILPLIAEMVLDKKGVVYGAAFDNSTNQVVHISSQNHDIKKIYKSKYVQSNVSQIYKEVKANLDEGLLVLFTGTPCQISGLKAFLSFEYNNLLTIDFMCHGVPSPLIFSDMLKLNKKKNTNIDNCTFRDKDKGWKTQIIKLIYSNGQTKVNRSKFSYYYNLFIQNYILRDSCYQCSLYNKHKSDLTLSDAWNYPDTINGVSKVFINTVKGNNIFSSIDKDLIICKSFKNVDLDPYKHKYDHTKKELFFKEYNKNKNKKILFLKFKYICLINKIRNRIIQNGKFKN